jgi:hypothetical protein
MNRAGLYAGAARQQITRYYQMATESTEEHRRIKALVSDISVFFREFRG